MASLLILAFPVVLWFLFRRRGYRSPILLAAISTAVVAVVLVECLSVFNAITFRWLLVSWAAVDILALIACFVARPVSAQSISRVGAGVGHWIILAALAALLSLIGVTAVVGAPNNNDGMVYHLARVAHWVENQSIRPYPTHVPRQAHQPPGAEYLLLTLQALSGGDHLANLLEWVAMVLSIIAAAGLARELGAGLMGQLIAAVVAGTLPLGILEGANVQNDWVLTLWLVCFVLFALKPGIGLAAGAALGLALLTKGTAYLFATPLAIWLAIRACRTSGRRAIQPMLIAAALAAIINGPFWIQNYKLCGHPLGPGIEGDCYYANGTFGPRVLLSNLMRGASAEIVSPYYGINHGVDVATRQLHSIMGLSVDDARTTFAFTTFEVSDKWGSEDVAGNPLHLLLLLVAGAWAMSRRELRGYVLALGAGVLFFCGYLRWQPWGVRLHLPILVLAAPIAGIMADRAMTRRVAFLTAGCLLAVAPLWAVYGLAHPLTGMWSIWQYPRERQYFTNAPDRSYMIDELRKIRQSGATRVGLTSDRIDGYEYPVWVLLPGVQIENVAVKNYTTIAPDPAPGFVPQVEVSIDLPVVGHH